jgi:hypothetical protein
MAQITDFSQRGRATQELRAVGYGIAHPSLPLNSRVMVANTLTGKEVEVTVVGRIPASPQRIADLSPDAWQELGLNPGAEIRIFTNSPVRPRPVANTTPVVPVQIDTNIDTNPDIIRRLAALEAWVAHYTPEPGFIERLIILANMEMPPSPDPEIMDRLAVLEYWMMYSSPYPDPEIMEKLLLLSYGETFFTSDPEVWERLIALEDWVTLHSPDPDFLDRLKILAAMEMPPGPDPEIMERLTALEYGQIYGTDPEIIQRLKALEAWVELHNPYPDFMERLMALEDWVSQYRPDSGIVERLIALEGWVSQYRPDPEIMERLAALEARQGTVELAGPQPAPALTHNVPVHVTIPRVIPGIPDPHSGKVFRLQVGAFSTLEAADRLARLVSSAGFNVVREQSGSMFRVLATNVPAALIHQAIQRLGVIGINQVWVRE